MPRSRQPLPMTAENIPKSPLRADSYATARLQRRLSLFLGKSWEGRQLKLEIIQFLRSVVPLSRLCLVDHDKQGKMSRTDSKRLQLFVVNACDGPRDQARAHKHAGARHLGNHVFAHHPNEPLVVRLHRSNCP